VGFLSVFSIILNGYKFCVISIIIKQILKKAMV